MKQLWINLKKIKVIKRDKDYFFITEKQAESIEEAKKLKLDMIKIIDIDNWKVLFWWDPRELKEFVEDFSKVKMKHSEIEDMQRMDNHYLYEKNNIKKNEWTENKLKEPWMDKLFDMFIIKARQKLENAVDKKWIWEDFIYNYALCKFRIYNNCPYK